MATTVPSVTLNNGVAMPILGFGVYQVPPEDTEQAVATALEVGYRLIDTAASYENEEAVGRALGSSGIPREELFVTTKLWIQNPGEAKARAAFHASLERLGLALPTPRRPGAHAPPRRSDGVVGLAEGRNNLFTDPTLTAIAEAHGKSVAQVTLRWLIQRGIVTIPKSVRRERMEQNLDVFDFTLSDDEMARIAPMDTGASLFFDPATPRWSACSTAVETPETVPRPDARNGTEPPGLKRRLGTISRPPSHRARTSRPDRSSG